METNQSEKVESTTDALSNGCTPIDVILDFKALDQNEDGEITAVEFINGLRSNRHLALKFGLSDDIPDEDGIREKYELIFGSVGYTQSETVHIWKLLKHFGHGDLTECKLAGLLSECGYKGDQLTAILHKTAENREKPNALTRHKSVIVRTAATALERRPSLRRAVPESTEVICCTSCVIFICCGGFFSSMVVGIIGAAGYSATWQDSASAAALGWTATRCIVLRRGCQCQCCNGGSALYDPKCERVDVDGGRQGNTKCKEDIKPFALLQYRRPDGSGWSQPLITQVFWDDFHAIVTPLNLTDQQWESSQISCWVDPADPNSVSVKIVTAMFEYLKNWKDGFTAMAVLGGLFFFGATVQVCMYFFLQP